MLARFVAVLLVLIFAWGTAPSFAAPDPRDGPDDEDVCIQRELQALSLYSGKLDGKLGPASKAAAAKLAEQRGWTLPPLTNETDDLWCDMMVADAIGLPELTSLPHPGELFLSRYDQVENSDICLAPTGLADYYQAKVLEQEPPVKVILVHGSGEESNTNLIEDLSGALMAYAPAAYLKLDAPNDDEVKAKLLEWADADALRSFQSLDGAMGSGYWFQVYELLSTLMYARDAYRAGGQFTPDEDARVTGWIGKLIERVEIGQVLNNRDGAGGEQRVNNHNGRRAMIAALWAIETNDVDGFNRAVREGYVRFLRNMREDGSLIDASRGAWALRYTSYHIGTMMALAEAARHQGIDLYHLEINGRSIEDAITFLLDADDDNSLIYRYAKANEHGRPGAWNNKKQDPDWKLQNEGGVFNRAAWMNLFALRFPDSDLTPRLLKVREQFYAATPITFMMDRAMGNMSCYWPELDKVPGPKIPRLSESPLSDITIDSVINNMPANSAEIDTHFLGSLTAATGDSYRLNFFIKGTLDTARKQFSSPMRLVVDAPISAGDKSHLMDCGVRFDGNNIEFSFLVDGMNHNLMNAGCVMETKTPSVEILGVMAGHFSEIAGEINKLGKAVTNPQLRAFLKEASNGGATFSVE